MNDDARAALWSRLTSRRVFEGDAQNATYAEILASVIAVVGANAIARELRISATVVRRWASGKVQISRMVRKFLPPVLADLLTAAPAGAVAPKRGRAPGARPLARNTQARLRQ